MKYLKITKLSESENPAFRAATWEEENSSNVNQILSIPIEYTVEGFLLRDIEVGRGIILDRRTRNGVRILGNFHTSKVVKLSGKVAITLNSVYLIEEKDAGEEKE